MDWVLHKRKPMETKPIVNQDLKDMYVVRNLTTGKLLTKYAGGFAWASLSVALNNAEKQCNGHHNRFKITDFVIEMFTPTQKDVWDAASLSAAKN